MTRSDIVLVSLNGFTNHDTSKDTCGIVRRVVRQLGVETELSLYHMGGAGVLVFNRLARKIEKLARAAQDDPMRRGMLVLIGKSYGGHWCRRLLWRLARKNLLDGFCKVRLVAVDPQFMLTSLVRTSKRIPDSVESICFRQAGFMGGYAIEPGKNILLEATHGGIHDRPEVEIAIREALTRPHHAIGF